MSEQAIVIGAGFSGLATAALLAHKKYKVTLLEKNDRIGGRARSLEKTTVLPSTWDPHGT